MNDFDVVTGPAPSRLKPPAPEPRRPEMPISPAGRAGDTAGAREPQPMAEQRPR